MIDTADITQRTIELERADAARKARDSCIERLKSHEVKSEPYRKAFKRAIRLLMDLKIAE